MTHDDNPLSPVTPLQRYVWNIAAGHYKDSSRLDLDRLPPAVLRLEAAKILETLGEVLRVCAEHFDAIDKKWNEY